MSLRAKLMVVLDVILRVPPLFIMDEFLRNNFGLGRLIGPKWSTNEELSIYELLFRGWLKFDAEFFKLLTVALMKVFLSGIGCFTATCVFLLSLKHLLTVYLYVGFVGIVFASYWANVFTMTAALSAGNDHQAIISDIISLNLIKILSPTSVGVIVISNYIAQLLLSYLFLYTYSHFGPKCPLLNKVLPLSFLGPSLLALLPLPESVLMQSPVFAAFFPLALIKFVLWCSALTVVQILYSAYEFARTAVYTYGLTALVEAQWRRLNIPRILRTFWLLRVAERATVLMLENYRSGNPGELADVSTLMFMSKHLLVTGCETVTAIIGMTSVVSFICHYIGSFFQWILRTDDEDDKSIGTISAILFYILSLQTGLTSLDPEKRYIRLGRNFCLLCTAVLHFIHNIVNPLLLSLSASNNPSVHRHVRALSVCAFLIAFPATLLYYLWSDQTPSTWLLAVTAFSIEVIIKVLVSLVMYTLFLLDTHRLVFWEKLDDYVFYTRAFGNTVEFLFGIFLFLNGAWILVYEAGGAIRAMMMCIHAYFNIWCEAKAGWNSFMKRRTAVGKINSLPEANSEQLESIDDVCAICFQNMNSAKVTQCHHFFHGVCLRKWLYVQDRCPLCHEVLYKE